MVYCSIDSVPNLGAVAARHHYVVFIKGGKSLIFKLTMCQSLLSNFICICPGINITLQLAFLQDFAQACKLNFMPTADHLSLRGSHYM